MAVQDLKTHGWSFLFDALDKFGKYEEDALAGVCPTCLGAGEVRWNPSAVRDPQCEDFAVCPDCDGTGAKRDA